MDLIIFGIGFILGGITGFVILITIIVGGNEK